MSNDGTVDVGDSAPMTVMASPAGADGTFSLSYDTSIFSVTTDAAGNNVVNPGDALTLNHGYAQLYLWGVGSTSDPNGDQITLDYTEGRHSRRALPPRTPTRRHPLPACREAGNARCHCAAPGGGTMADWQGMAI